MHICGSHPHAGYYVIATSRRLETMQDLVKSELIETVQLDVCSEESITRAKKTIEVLTAGKLDYLVNNAQVVPLSRFSQALAD